MSRKISTSMRKEDQTIPILRGQRHWDYDKDFKAIIIKIICYIIMTTLET